MANPTTLSASSSPSSPSAVRVLQIGPLPLPALTRWWKQLADSARSAEHPLNAGLETEFLVSSAHQALNSKS